MEAERVAALFGLTVRAQPLGSQQDSNFLLADGGSVLGVLKIANPAFSAAEIEAQDAAAAHIAAARPDLRVATVTHGPAEVPVDGSRALARVLRFLPGGTLAGAGRYLSPRVVAGLGAVAGQVSLALSSFEHPGLDRVLQWDLRHARRVVDALAGHVRDEDLRGRVTAAAAAAWSRVEPLAGRLPWQAVHGDVTDDNVVCLVERGLRTPDGIIDFGDLTSSWAVGELAVAITSVLRHAGAEPCSVLPAVRAFHESQAAVRRGGRGAVAAGRAARRRAGGQRRAAGRHRRRQRLRDRRAGARAAPVRAGHVGAGRGDDGPDPGRARAGRRAVAGLRPGGGWTWGPWIWGAARCWICPSDPTRWTRGRGWSRGSRTGWRRPCWPTGTTPWPPGSARRG